MLPVLHGHSLVGVLTRDNIEEWLMVRSALRQGAELRGRGESHPELGWAFGLAEQLALRTRSGSSAE